MAARASWGGFRSSAASLAGEHLAWRCEFRVLDAGRLGRGCKSGVVFALSSMGNTLIACGRGKAISPLPVSHAAPGIASSPGFAE